MFLINEDVTSYLALGTVVFKDGRTLEEAREQKSDLSKARTNRSGEPDPARAAAARAGQQRAKPETFKREDKKVGRNDPCPCGSGKKFKHCHGRVK
jgi:preprotein translocase subunit SecA